MGVEPEEVHEEMLVLLAPPRPAPAETDDARRVVPAGVPNHASSCRHCAGYLERDEREGRIVCASCGVVQGVITSSWTPPEADDVTGASGKRVASYSRARAIVSDDSPEEKRARRRRSIAADVAHWAVYSNLPEMSTRRVVDLVERRDLKRPRVETLAAAFIIVELDGAVPGEEHVREQLSKHRVPDEIKRPAPVVSFPCATCGAPCGSAKGARYHCR